MATNNKMASIPYVAYEQERMLHDKEKRRWFIICLVLIAALIASNVAWIIHESKYETVNETVETEEAYTYEYDVEQEADGNGDNNFIGGDGVINE